MKTKRARPTSTSAAALMALFRAIASGDGRAVFQVLAESPELARHASAVGATRQESKKYFVEEIGCYVFAGDTALHLAAAAYRRDLAEMLVGEGADLAARNRRGAEPLHYASVGAPGSRTWNPEAQKEIIGYLIDAGADPNAADKDGVASLHRAVRTRCAAAVWTLLAKGADPLRKNNSGSTPVHLAVQGTGRGGTGSSTAREQQEAIIRLLLQRGARLTDRNGRGKTVQQSMTNDWIREI